MSYPRNPYIPPLSNANSPPYPPYPNSMMSAPPYPTQLGAQAGFAPQYQTGSIPNTNIYPSIPSVPTAPYPPSFGAPSPAYLPYPHQPNPPMMQSNVQLAASYNPNPYASYPQQFASCSGFQQTTYAVQTTSMQGYPQVHQGNPTLRPAPNFDAVADAQVLRKAMKGFGTDENALINILCRRSNDQRQAIRQTYKTSFGKDLIEDISSETSGNFENLLVALLKPSIDFYAIDQAYERIYGKSLEKELKSETSFHFKRLMVSLCTGNRDVSGIVNHEAANRDAQQLMEAGVNRIGTDESVFNMILCQRNFAQIKLIAEVYLQMTGRCLESAIKSEFSGDIKRGLLAILRCSVNKDEFFSNFFYQSMHGLGTNNNQLIRLVVTQCEIDLMDIKMTFQEIYGSSLRKWIEDDTSGHYKHALFALVGD